MVDKPARGLFSVLLATTTTGSNSNNDGGVTSCCRSYRANSKPTRLLRAAQAMSRHDHLLPKLLMLVGLPYLPRSGKSTFAEALVASGHYG
jgi:hypothetical protein